MSSDGAKLAEIAATTERIVLAACAYDARFRGAWLVDPELFRLPAHRALAVVMARCQRSGAQWDDATITLELKRDGKLELFPGGAQGVAELLLETPAVNDPWPQVQLLRDIVSLRETRAKVLEATHKAESECDLSEYRAALGEAVSAAFAASGQQARPSEIVFADAFRKASNPQLRERGIKTGVKGVDSATGGLRRRNCWVIAAQSNWGKSAFLVNLADRAALRGAKVAIVYGEDPEELYAHRWLARRANVPVHRFRDHELQPEDMQAVTRVIDASRGWAYFVNGIGRPVESLAGDIRSLCASEGVSVVLVDYLQCFRVQAQLENQRLRIAYIAQTFSQAIKSSNAAGVMFSQVTEKDGKLHVRDSEDVRNDTEVLLIGKTLKEPDLDANGTRRGEIERKFFYLDKVKDGPHGFEVELDWEPLLASFQRDTRLYRVNDDEYAEN